MIVFLVVALFIIFVIYTEVVFLIDAKRFSITGPRPWPLIGNGHLFIGDSSHFIHITGKLAEKYGNAFRVFIFNRKYAIISDPKILQSLTTSMEHIDKSYMYKALHSWMGLGLLTSTGHRWQKHRKFLTPAFHFSKLQTFLPLFLKNKEMLLRNLAVHADGRSFDIFPIIALNALDNISESAMGVSINAQNDSESDYIKAVNINAKITMMRQFNPLLLEDVFFNLHSYKKQSDEAIAVLHGHSKAIIEKRRKMLKEANVTMTNYDQSGMKNKFSFLDLMLLGEVDGEKLDMNSIREEVDTFMFEGHDTTSSAVSFILFNISNNQDAQDKIIEEQISIFGPNSDREPDHRDLKEMKYLDAVIKESLRLHPSVPYFARQITKDCNIGGVFIPKDTSITIDVFHMQRNPKYFKDPLEFRPERFLLNEDLGLSSSCPSWIPFSAGPRNCIGQKFALMQLKVNVSCVVRRYRLLAVRAEPQLKADLVLGARDGVQVRLLPRN